MLAGKSAWRGSGGGAARVPGAEVEAQRLLRVQAHRPAVPAVRQEHHTWASQSSTSSAQSISPERQAEQAAKRRGHEPRVVVAAEARELGLARSSPPSIALRRRAAMATVYNLLRPAAQVLRRSRRRDRGRRPRPARVRLHGRVARGRRASTTRCASCASGPGSRAPSPVGFFVLDREAVALFMRTPQGAPSRAACCSRSRASPPVRCTSG